MTTDIAVLEIEGTWNARDVATLAGIRPGVLLRSAALPGLTPAGEAELVALGVTDVVDLRSEAEVATQGADVVPEHVTVHRTPISPGSALAAGPAAGAAAADLQEQVLAKLREPGWAEGFMNQLYTEIVTTPEWVAQLGAGLRTIADAPGATLVHCAAGKDRTGVLVALACLVAGADPHDIAEDFLQSNAAREHQLGIQGLPPVDAELLRPLLGVHLTSLEAAQAALSATWGGLPGFLEAAGVSPDHVARLTERLSAA